MNHPVSTGDIAFFTGTLHPKLGNSVVQQLNHEMGKCYIDRFSDGEIHLRIDENVRGKDVYVFQSTPPPGENLLELLLLTDALRRASAARITAIMPYMGYTRQDRRLASSRAPISAKVIADLLVCSGLSRVLTVDLHSEQIQGFFSVPVDNIYASPVLLDDIRSQSSSDAAADHLCVVSPDIGGVVRARAYAKKLDCELAIIDKRRGQANHSEVVNVIGDIANKKCILVDDIVDTAGTLCNAAAELKQRGASRVVAYCTHAVLSGDATERVTKAQLDELVVTDTLPLSKTAGKCAKIRQISMASMLAEAIQRITSSGSLSALFN